VKPTTVIEYKRHLDKTPRKPLDSIKKEDVDLSEAQAVKTWKIFYNWCIRHELTDRNPFAHIPVKYGRRDRLLTNEEIKAIWDYDHPPYSDMLKLLLLTGQRRNQIWRLNPEWVDKDVIAFPGGVMKSGLNHTIPIGKLTQKLVTKAPFSFNSWSKAKARCDGKTGVDDWTVHDLRRVFVTKCAESGQIPLHVTEAYVDHRSGTVSGVQAIYLKYDFMKEMKKLVVTYEQFLETIVA
jgi:integrase